MTICDEGEPMEQRPSKNKVDTAFNRACNVLGELFAGKQAVKEVAPQTLGCERYRLTFSGALFSEVNEAMHDLGVAIRESTAVEPRARNDLADDLDELAEDLLATDTTEEGADLCRRAASALRMAEDVIANTREPEPPTEDRRDAERYRWLRENGNAFLNACHYRGKGEVFDSEVDAARTSPTKSAVFTNEQIEAIERDSEELLTRMTPGKVADEKPDAIDDDHVCGVCEGTQRGVCNCKAGEKPADLYTAVESAVRKADADLADAVRGAGETSDGHTCDVSLDCKPCDRGDDLKEQP